MESDTIIAIIGYVLAILFPLIGVIFGIILFFLKGDNEYLKKHAKYIIILGIVMMVLSIALAMMFGITAVGMSAMS